MREIAEELVRNLGQRVGAEDLDLDEDGYCCIAFDEVVVSFEFDEDSNAFLLSAKVADAPAKISSRYFEETLELSFSAMLTSGGSLGIDRIDGAVMFADRVSLRGVDATTFEKSVEDFVNRVEDWRRLFASPDFRRNVSESPDLGEVGEMMRI